MSCLQRFITEVESMLGTTPLLTNPLKTITCRSLEFEVVATTTSQLPLSNDRGKTLPELLLDFGSSNPHLGSGKADISRLDPWENASNQWSDTCQEAAKYDVLVSAGAKLSEAIEMRHSFWVSFGECCTTLHDSVASRIVNHT